MSYPNHNTPRPIHVGILVSYDYKYIPLCLAQIYDKAYKITLVIDVNRKTWAGNPFEFDEDFLKEILRSDVQHKISIYEDDFSSTERNAMESERRERKMLRDFMQSEQEDAWHLQIDSDEYFVDFAGFVDYLHALEKSYRGNITVMAKLNTIYKVVDGGIIMAVDDAGGYFPVASIGGCRFVPAKDEIVVRTDFTVLHQSWGRPEGEIGFKISNWGHREDFDVDSYFEFWKSVNRYNAPYIRNCHPLGERAGWNRLKFEPGLLDEIIKRLRESAPQHQFKRSVILKAKLEPTITKLRNSRLANSVKPLIKKWLR